MGNEPAKPLSLPARGLGWQGKRERVGERRSGGMGRGGRGGKGRPEGPPKNVNRGMLGLF